MKITVAHSYISTLHAVTVICVIPIWYDEKQFRKELSMQSHTPLEMLSCTRMATITINIRYRKSLCVKVVEGVANDYIS